MWFSFNIVGMSSFGLGWQFPQWTFKKKKLLAAAAAAKTLQSCPTLCDPTDGNPPGSPIPGILQARTREWVAISFSDAWKWKEKVKLLSRVWLFAIPWTTAYQAPPSMGFSRQEYWSGEKPAWERANLSKSLVLPLKQLTRAPLFGKLPMMTQPKDNMELL